MSIMYWSIDDCLSFERDSYGMSSHICRGHNSIRELLSTRVIFIDYIKSNDNTADPLTKGLTRELVE